MRKKKETLFLAVQSSHVCVAFNFKISGGLSLTPRSFSPPPHGAVKGRIRCNGCDTGGCEGLS